MSSVIPILLAVAAGGAIVLGAGSKKKGSGSRRVTPGKAGLQSVPEWCKTHWSSERNLQVMGLVHSYVAQLPDYEGDTDEARRQTFEITKLVLAELCGAIDLPPEYFNLGGYYETKPQWWRDLWDRVAAHAWNTIVGPVDPF